MEPRACSDSHCPNGDQKLSPDAFYPNATRCKQCTNKRAVDRQLVKKHTTLEEFEQIKSTGEFRAAATHIREHGSPPATADPVSASPPIQDDELMHLIDFTKDYPETFEEIVELAKLGYRPVRFQIALVLRIGIESIQEEEGSE